MKKFLNLCFASAVCFSLCACGPNEDTESEEATSTASDYDNTNLVDYEATKILDYENCTMSLNGIYASDDFALSVTIENTSSTAYTIIIVSATVNNLSSTLTWTYTIDAKTDTTTKIIFEDTEDLEAQGVEKFTEIVFAIELYDEDHALCYETISEIYPYSE